MRPAANVVGERYGRVVIVGDGERVEPGKRYVACRCDCGRGFECRLDNLRSGNTRCCGCRRRLAASQARAMARARWAGGAAA